MVARHCVPLPTRSYWFGGRLPKATLGGDIGCELKLRIQFHVSGNRVGNEAVCLHLGHDRSGGRDVGLAAQDHDWPDVDFNNSIFAVDVCQQAFCGAFVGHEFQLLTLGERYKRQHHASIQRGDQHFFGGPDARISLEFRRTADLDVGFSGCRRSAAASGVPDQVVPVLKGLVCFPCWHVSLQCTEIVGWAKRSVPTIETAMRMDGGHGAVRLCPPYDAATCSVSSASSYHPAPAAAS